MDGSVDWLTDAWIDSAIDGWIDTWIDESVDWFVSLFVDFHCMRFGLIFHDDITASPIHKWYIVLISSIVLLIYASLRWLTPTRPSLNVSCCWRATSCQTRNTSDCWPSTNKSRRPSNATLSPRDRDRTALWPTRWASQEGSVVNGWGQREYQSSLLFFESLKSQ